MERTKQPRKGEVVDFALAKRRRQPARARHTYRLSLLFSTDWPLSQKELKEMFSPIRALPGNWDVPHTLRMRMAELIAEVASSRAVDVKVDYSNWDEEAGYDEAS